MCTSEDLQISQNLEIYLMCLKDFQINEHSTVVVGSKYTLSLIQKYAKLGIFLYFSKVTIPFILVPLQCMYSKILTRSVPCFLQPVTGSFRGQIVQYLYGLSFPNHNAFCLVLQDLPSGYNSGEQYDTLSTGSYLFLFINSLI